MTSEVSGIRLVHAGGDKPGGRPGQIVDVAFGFRTNYALAIEIETASCSVILAFSSPFSFRVQEERDLMDYWYARDREGVGIGILYTVERSPYRAEFAATISGQTEPFDHYLVAGDDVCVCVSRFYARRRRDCRRSGEVAWNAEGR